MKKRIAKRTYSRSGKYVFQKMTSVDVPFSQEAFTLMIHQCICEEKSFKIGKNITASCDPSVFNDVFGSDWYYVYIKKSNTARRIIGLIKLAYRQKALKVVGPSAVNTGYVHKIQCVKMWN